MKCLIITIALNVVFAMPMAARQELPVTPGEQIRISIREFGLVRQRATYLGLSDGMLEFEVKGSETVRRIEVGSVLSLDAHDGRIPHARVGAVIGYVTLGLAAVVTTAIDPGDEAYSSGAALGYFLVYGAVGAGIGGLVGAFVVTDRWRSVSLENFNVSAAKRPGGLNLGARLEF